MINLIDESNNTENSIKNVLSEYNEQNIEEKPNINEVLKDIEESNKKEKEKESSLEFTFKDPESNTKSKVSADTILKGSVVMLLINVMVPNVLALVHNKFAKGFEPINKNDLKAPKSVLKELEPLADEVFKTMEVKSSPMSLFFMGLFATYGISYLNMLEPIKKKEEENEKR